MFVSCSNNDHLIVNYNSIKSRCLHSVCYISQIWLVCVKIDFLCLSRISNGSCVVVKPASHVVE